MRTRLRNSRPSPSRWCALFVFCSVLRIHLEQQSALTNGIAVQNESFSTALQAEAAAFASEPLDESKFAHSGYEFLQKDKLRDKYARISITLSNQIQIKHTLKQLENYYEYMLVV